VAIIVPYRQREAHLRLFLHNMHRFLAKQTVQFSIYVVEHVCESSFGLFVSKDPPSHVTVATPIEKTLTEGSVAVLYKVL
jgi:hypothetical protein